MEQQKVLTLSGLSYFKDKIISIIEDNESVTATALADLDDRLKNHEHTVNNMPDEFNNMTLEQVLNALNTVIVGNQSAITELENKVAGCAPKSHSTDTKIHLPRTSNDSVKDTVLFLQAVNDQTDQTNAKPKWTPLPVADASKAGIITNVDQTIAGPKTLTHALKVQDTLTINGKTDNSGNTKFIQFDSYYDADLFMDGANNMLTVNAQGLAFNQQYASGAIRFNGNIYQTKFELKDNITRPATIYIKPGIVTRLKLNYIETGSGLKLKLGSVYSGLSLTTGTPYSAKCYITVAESVPENSTGLITLSDAKTPESIQYGKSSVIEVSITGFYGELEKYCSWRYIYV